MILYEHDYDYVTRWLPEIPVLGISFVVACILCNFARNIFVVILERMVLEKVLKQVRKDSLNQTVLSYCEMR